MEHTGERDYVTHAIKEIIRPKNAWSDLAKICIVGGLSPKPKPLELAPEAIILHVLSDEVDLHKITSLIEALAPTCT